MPSSTVNINNWSNKQKQQWLNAFDVIFTDCDGVLWHDDDIIPGAAETINALKNLQKNIYFVTNNATKTRYDLWQKALRMQFNIKETDILAPTFSVAHYLKTHLKPEQNVYVIGTESLTKELNSLNINNFGVGPDTITSNWFELYQMYEKQSESDNVGAVVVGFDPDFSFNKMIKALNFLEKNKKCLFLATNSDAVSKFPKYCIPGTGAFLKAIETCVYRNAIVMGKPNPMICQDLIEQGLINPKRTLMIGDCYKVDVAFGKQCGFQTLLVGTGRYKWQDVEEIIKNNDFDCLPDFYINSISDLGTKSN